MSIPITPQYDPKSLYTDGCSSPECRGVMSAPSSLSQGQTFGRLTTGLHGGRRSRRSHRSRRNTRRNRRGRRMNMMGGAADYPNQFSELLPNGMHAAADVGKLDAAFAQLPQFVGKYGGVGGSRRRGSKRRGSKRATKRALRGGGFGYTPGPTNTPNYMILSPSEEPKAFLNPQWYTENEVVPTFKGPENAFAQQSYNNQFNYAQRAGSRKRRTSRKGRKNSRKGGRRH